MRGQAGVIWASPILWFRRANKKVLLVVSLVLMALGYLMATNLPGALTFFYTVEELQARGPEAYGERVRVGGRVMEGSIEKDAANNLSFAIYHNMAANALPVRYKGIVPNIFGEAVDVIVEGEWNAEDGLFYATKLLTQHPPEFKVAEPNTPHAQVRD